MNWEAGIDIDLPLILCIKYNENLLYSSGNSTFCGDPNRKEIHKRGKVYIQITDSLCCTVETNTTLQSNYIPIKINLKKRGPRNSPCFKYISV